MNRREIIIGAAAAAIVPAIASALPAAAEEVSPWSVWIYDKWVPLPVSAYDEIIATEVIAVGKPFDFAKTIGDCGRFCVCEDGTAMIEWLAADHV